MGISSNALDGCTGLTSMSIDMKQWYDRAIPAGLLKDCTCISGLITDGEAFDVYDMSGRKVRTATSSLDGLPKGIYVVNGKKVMK